MGIHDDKPLPIETKPMVYYSAPDDLMMCDQAEWIQSFSNTSALWSPRCRRTYVLPSKIAAPARAVPHPKDEYELNHIIQASLATRRGGEVAATYVTVELVAVDVEVDVYLVVGGTEEIDVFVELQFPN